MKAIPAGRERLQSAWLVGMVGGLLGMSCVFYVGLWLLAPVRRPLFVALGLSLTFALVVWALRAATGAAAACGGMICLLVIAEAGGSALRSGLLPLVALFVLTFAATRVRGAKKAGGARTEEDRRGRSAGQVVANLGTAGLVWMIAFVANPFFGRLVSHLVEVLLLAVLCEATADTVASEIGQAFGGTPWMVTTLRRVAAGTDGAVSLFGTGAGALGALLVAGVGTWSLRLGWREAGIAVAGGVAGLVFDSVLGATVERRGWLGNDLVNFCSTVFAVGVAWVGMVVG